MTRIGFFSEMKFSDHCGSIREYQVESVNYDKQKVIEYLSRGKRIAGCPREGIDCITGKTISKSFSVYSDGEYEWCDFLIYHIRLYNIKLPDELLKKVQEGEFEVKSVLR